MINSMDYFSIFNNWHSLCAYFHMNLFLIIIKAAKEVSLHIALVPNLNFFSFYVLILPKAASFTIQIFDFLCLS
jgi:hypothetical protein